jgi:dimethylargininase
MLTAITRRVSPALNRCELEYLERRPIDLAKAAAQHRAYEERLEALGVVVVSLPSEPDLPDSVFVEDPAVVLDEVAVIARMGAESRRPEAESLAEVLSRYRPLRRLCEPATLEGGDVMRIGRALYVGASRRTNAEGIRQLAEAVEPFGYTVIPVRVRGCLHLKSACCYAGRGAVLVNRQWIDPAPLAGLELIDVAPAEPGAANVLPIRETLLIPAAFPATRRVLEAASYHVETLDISELMKAEAALTCSSLICET